MTEEDAPAPKDTSGEVLVDDLVGATDAWLSITDAARVTRRQEITIRRWIAAGLLPVRRQRMGRNKRTRHVRASDLEQITPIIDLSAAITGGPASVDLMSIPERQAQLFAAQQEQDQALVVMQEKYADLHEAVRDQGEREQQDMAQLRQESVATAQALTERLHASDQQWDAQITTQRQSLEATIQYTAEALQRNDAAFAQRLDALVITVSEHRDSTQAQITAFQQTMHQEIAALVAHHEQTTREHQQAWEARLLPLQTQLATLLQLVDQHDAQMHHSTTALQDALAALSQHQVRTAQITLRLAELERQRRHTTRTTVRRRHRQPSIEPVL